jgi:hypothetical protein
MDRTDLPDKPRPKPIKHPVDHDERSEEPRYRVCIIRPELPVVPEWDRIGDLIGSSVEFRRTAKIIHQLTEPGVKFGGGHWPERHFSSAPISCRSDEDMTEEIEGDFYT